MNTNAMHGVQRAVRCTIYLRYLLLAIYYFTPSFFNILTI
jgi:hypothetical protein